MEFNEANTKALVGENDKITCKPLYHDPFSFLPIVKIYVLTNKIVYFDANSTAMLNRFHLINMNAVFSESPDYSKGEYLKDSEFVNKLKTEYRHEVFSWIVDGAYMYYQKNKIEKPKAMEEEQKAYVENIDAVQSFIDLKCVVGIKYRNNRKVLYEEFIRHCKDCGDTFVGMSPQKFYDVLHKKKFGTMKSNGYFFITGLKLNTMDDDSDYENDENDNMLHNYKTAFDLKKKPELELSIFKNKTIEEPKINVITATSNIDPKQIKLIMDQFRSLQEGQIKMNSLKDKLKYFNDNMDESDSESEDDSNDESDTTKIDKYINGCLSLIF
jgi:phage/plasmid-associated DNA primase